MPSQLEPADPPSVDQQRYTRSAYQVLYGSAAWISTEFILRKILGDDAESAIRNRPEYPAVPAGVCSRDAVLWRKGNVHVHIKRQDKNNKTVHATSGPLCGPQRARIGRAVSKATTTNVFAREELGIRYTGAIHVDTWKKNADSPHADK